MQFYSLEHFELSLGLNISETIQAITNEKKFLQPIKVTINGKTRKITPVPSDSHLFTIQKRINSLILNDENFPDSVFGYRKNRSYFDFLVPHCDNYYYLKLDLKNFFESINTEKFNSFFNEIILINNTEKRNDVIQFLKEILFMNEKLPQGFSTSPLLSNIYFKRADLRIEKYCLNNNIKYSRYADDIILSSNKNIFKGTKVLSTINRILKDFDLSINYKKVRKAELELPVSGFVIGDEIRLSKNKLSKLKKMLFLIENNIHKKNWEYIIGEECGKRYYYIENILDYLSGMRSFMISSIKYTQNQSDWNIKCSKMISRIDNNISIVYNKSF